MNNVSLIGNISTDIDLTATPTGKFVAKFNLAVANPFNREKTSFLPIEIWGKNAENTSNFCVKGNKVGITGYIEVDQWEHEGQKRYKTKVVANTIEFLTPKGNGSGTQNNSSQGQQKPNIDPFGGVDVDDSNFPF